MMDTQDVERIRQRIDEQLPPPWPPWPGGYPDQIELALLDAVLSIRARYGSPHNGVRQRVNAWRSSREPDRPDDLSVLAAATPKTLANIVGHQVLSGGSTKAEGIALAADNLVNAGVRRAEDLDPASIEHQKAYTGVKGLGKVTWTYMVMLLGKPGVKADTWITRFVGEAVGAKRSPEECQALLTEVANTRGWSPTELDHAIWRYMRTR